VVALDLALDDGLRRRGLAREVIRNVQDLRKGMGLEVSDWIHLHLVGLDDLASLFELIGREVLARTVEASAPEGAGGGTALQLDDGDSAREARIWVVAV
jgi:isoleucyl-tRNA synthetase